MATSDRRIARRRGRYRAALVVIVATQAVANQQQGTPLELSSLKEGCRLQVDASGSPGPNVHLTCGKHRVLLLGAANLEGQVSIQTPSQALEFVRLFTGYDTWYLSTIDQMVEVRSGDSPDRVSFVVSEAFFAKHCVAPTVVPMPVLGSKKRFRVRRTVLDTDYRAFAITQIVDQDGSVAVTEKEPLAISGKDIGSFVNPYIM